ncbi:MAG: hypothetical protein AABY11_00110 [archaeon]
MSGKLFGKLFRRSKRPGSKKNGETSKPVNLSRRRVLKSAAYTGALASLAYLQSCVSLKTNKYDVEFDTRKPNSVKGVIESFPELSTHEVGFVKEFGRPGKMIGASMGRFEEFTLMDAKYNRKLRSWIHTHPAWDIIRGYPSSMDFSLHIERRLSKHSLLPFNTRFMHVVPIDDLGRVVGYTTIYLGKKWIKNEKSCPEILRSVVELGKKFDNSRVSGAINRLEYIELRRKLFNLYIQLGMKIRLTAMPPYHVSDTGDYYVWGEKSRE